MSSSVVKDKNLMIQQEEQIRYNSRSSSSRRPRNQSISPSSSSSADPTPQISPLLQSTRCKPTISSIFLSTFINNNNSNGTSSSSNNMKDNRDTAKKKKNLSSSSSSFRGFGCASTSSHQVSAPTVIRTSADWQAKKVRKKKQRKKQPNPTPLVVVPDVWCAPGISFSAADTDASVDCVVSRRPLHQSSRGRNDNNGGGGDRVSNNNHDTHRELQRPCISRRTATIEQISSILDSPSDLETSHNESEVFGARHHRHYRHDSPGGISEILMFQNSLLLGGRSSGHDRYRDLRLDVDNMTYEELLDLGESIGNVSTGLREDEIARCLRKTKHSILDALQSRFLTDMNWKCSICQEEYEADDEVGKLHCGHNYHICCIKQWLLQKNACPVCKVPVTAQD